MFVEENECFKWSNTFILHVVNKHIFQVLFFINQDMHNAWMQYKAIQELVNNIN